MQPPDLSERQASETLRELLWRSSFWELGKLWKDIQLTYGREGTRWLGRNDRYFLLTVLLHRTDAVHPWLYERCREVERNPDDFLDLWAREHYKSTVITFAGIIQEILRDPDITCCVFSHTRPNADKFLVQIKMELEQNEGLPKLYPDVLYEKPKKQSPRWSVEKGIVVKRTINPKEATLSASGLVDGMPTGSHFRLRVYDDVVTLESIATPDQVKKTTDAWALSDNLGARGPNGEPGRAWHIGTRYHFADTYADIIERKALKPRLHAATHDGTPNGKPVFFTKDVWESKKLKQGMPIIAAQMLQNPAAGGNTMFDREWLENSFRDVRPATLNVYIMCDPASSIKKGSDYTAIVAIGVDAAGNFWLIDGLRARLKLAGRWNALYQMRKRWMNEPGVQVVEVGYERYGLKSDLEYFEERMEAVKEEFEIIELAWPKEGGNAKPDRIQRLEPFFRNRRFYLPALQDKESAQQRKMRTSGQAYRIFKPTVRADQDGNRYSVNQVFLNEYLVYPFSAHDDFLDAMSRIFDMDYRKPEIVDQKTTEPTVHADGV